MPRPVFHRLALLVCLSAGVGAPAWGQAAPARSDSVRARLVMPGDSTLRSARIQGGSARYTLTAYRDGDEIPMGRLSDVVRVDTINGAPVLRRVQLLQRNMQQLVDSTLTDVNTFAPRQHRSQQPTRRITLDFTGRRVKGALAPEGVPPVVLDTTLAVAAFDSGNWDLVMRALPLDSGYKVRFPVYDIDVGLHQYQVEVTGSTTVQGELAHVVIFTMAKGREAVVWVGKSSGLVLQMETMVSQNTMLRQVIQRER
jgi:hypothetical protein